MPSRAPRSGDGKPTTGLVECLPDDTPGVTESVEHRVRLATSKDRGAVVDVLTTAFLADPLFGHLLPPSMSRREARLRQAFAIEVARSQKRGGTWGRRGNDGVLPTGPVAVHRLGGPSRRGTVEVHLRLEHGDGVGGDLAHEGRTGNPARPLVPLLRRRRSIAAELGHRHGAAQDVLEECDRTGTPAYVQASNGKSHAIGARYGFVDRPAFALPHGWPTVHPMWREPA
jgi:hypothetical protein